MSMGADCDLLLIKSLTFVVFSAVLWAKVFLWHWIAVVIPTQLCFWVKMMTCFLRGYKNPTGNFHESIFTGNTCPPLVACIICAVLGERPHTFLCYFEVAVTCCSNASPIGYWLTELFCDISKHIAWMGKYVYEMVFKVAAILLLPCLLYTVQSLK